MQVCNATSQYGRTRVALQNFSHIRRHSTADAIVKDLFGNPARAVAVAQFNSYKGIEQFPCKPIPEFLFTGRANVGKSSLINAIMAKKKLVRSSSKPGATKTLNFFGPGSIRSSEPKLYLVDGPGYGLRGRPEWGQLFMDYASNRPTLRRIFVLISLSHGLKDSDKNMLKDLHDLTEHSSTDRDRLHPLSFQIVFTKIDEAKGDTSMLRQRINLVKREVWEIAPTCMPEAILTSSVASLDPGMRLGIEKMRTCIAEAGGFL